MPRNGNIKFSKGRGRCACGLKYGKGVELVYSQYRWRIKDCERCAEIANAPQKIAYKGGWCAGCGVDFYRGSKLWWDTRKGLWRVVDCEDCRLKDLEERGQ